MLNGGGTHWDSLPTPAPPLALPHRSCSSPCSFSRTATAAVGRALTAVLEVAAAIIVNVGAGGGSGERRVKGSSAQPHAFRQPASVGIL